MGRCIWAASAAIVAALALLFFQTTSARAGTVMPGVNTPAAETNTCTNGQDLFQVATCVITLTSGTGGSPVVDGIVSVHLSDPASSAVLGCAGPGCVINNNGTDVDLTCGQVGPAVSITCTSVSFTIASPLAACINSPATCARNANLNATSATVTVSFRSSAGNASGTVVLSQDQISFQGPNIGVLLVTASPQLIPSNGTAASVITATFACGTVSPQRNTSSIPLSQTGFQTVRGPNGLLQVTNVPVLGTGQNAPCGAGLPGGFTFSAARNLYFDNGRSTEGVGCGVGANVSPFGGINPSTPYHVTAPLIFTCTGAAVLAIGNGHAGDAPINVVYTSSVGGLSAVGSTVVTVSPSPQAIITMSCNPLILSPGGPAAFCTASVVDQNGVPLSGLNASTITFTTSDATNTVVTACGYGTAGSINQTTTPHIAPQMSPQQPCQLPTNWVPSQVNTAFDGTAEALISAVPGAPVETVTVSASLEFYLPPSTACITAPYLPSYFNPNTTGVGLPSVTGCGSANPVGYTGTAAGLSSATAAINGPTVITNFEYSPSASTALQIGSTSSIVIAGGTATNPQQLTRGCNQIVVTSSLGTPLTTIQALVTPGDTVASIWRFSNETKQYQAGLFNDPQAPTDFSVTGLVGENGAESAPPPGNLSNLVIESYFVCVVRPAKIPSS
jgi:hypothetical protein